MIVLLLIGPSHVLLFVCIERKEGKWFSIIPGTDWFRAVTLLNLSPFNSKLF